MHKSLNLHALFVFNVLFLLYGMKIATMNESGKNQYKDG
ncbi:hypothetical protein HNQ39_001775 [Armatimonas rosea]|uniref:Uncharacterized protein n=1 Tax=Armatimonas rosea TaxID=685828 RepID=A0A7W9W529_ARMRO|nr:hypothetical protein [Armatimonas rosea]